MTSTSLATVKREPAAGHRKTLRLSSRSYLGECSISYMVMSYENTNKTSNSELELRKRPYPWFSCLCRSSATNRNACQLITWD